MTIDALVGHTGFVGGTLLRQRSFDRTFNSRNIAEIRGQMFDTLVCAGVPAAKWLANNNPDQDWQGISGLIECLDAATVRHFVLISTIDVYREPFRLTEDDAPSVDGLEPYGLHRLRLERFVEERYASYTIVRLPALFGTGLKKNALYDLINLNRTDNIVPNATFQWYAMRRLNRDLELITEAGINLINVTAEPVTIEEVRTRFFPRVPIGPPIASPPRHDLRTIHDILLGGHGGYHLRAGQVFDEMASFLAESPKRL
jgi:nucleoside-diphosphate-sugar epimerase